MIAVFGKNDVHSLGKRVTQVVQDIVLTRHMYMETPAFRLGMKHSAGGSTARAVSATRHLLVLEDIDTVPLMLGSASD